jgi:hypothetical protein
MVDLLDNFLSFLSFFWLWWVISKNCYDQEWRGKERKINSGPATANQVQDGRKELKLKIFYKKYLIMQTLRIMYS